MCIVTVWPWPHPFIKRIFLQKFHILETLLYLIFHMMVFLLFLKPIYLEISILRKLWTFLFVHHIAFHFQVLENQAESLIIEVYAWHYWIKAPTSWQEMESQINYICTSQEKVDNSPLFLRWSEHTQEIVKWQLHLFSVFSHYDDEWGDDTTRTKYLVGEPSINSQVCLALTFQSSLYVNAIILSA